MKYINFKHKTIKNLLLKWTWRFGDTKIATIHQIQGMAENHFDFHIFLVFLSRRAGGQKYLWIFFHRNKYSNFEYFCQSMALWQTFLNVSIQVLKHLYEYKSPKLKIWLLTIEFLQLWCCANLISSNSNKIIKIWKCVLYYICILYFYVSDIS